MKVEPKGSPAMRVRVTSAEEGTHWYKVGQEYDVLQEVIPDKLGNYHPLVDNRRIGIGVNDFEIIVGAVPQEQPTRNKYSREIRPGVWVDCYDVLRAFNVTDPCLQHLAKKALAGGQRGHKDLGEDLRDILASAKRAVEMYEEWNAVE